MSQLLAEHDRLVVAAAAARGRAQVHGRAQVARPGGGRRSPRPARFATSWRNTVDVTVLDEWLYAQRDYDVALGTCTRRSRGRPKVTDATSATRSTAERTARAQLPPDTRGLVMIMAEIGRGGMSGAVIAIEEARGKLADAIDAADGARRPARAAHPRATDGP